MKTLYKIQKNVPLPGNRSVFRNPRRALIKKMKKSDSVLLKTPKEVRALWYAAYTDKKKIKTLVRRVSKRRFRVWRLT